jgi:hypothetical protein
VSPRRDTPDHGMSDFVGLPLALRYRLVSGRLLTLRMGYLLPDVLVDDSPFLRCQLTGHMLPGMAPNIAFCKFQIRRFYLPGE